MMMLELESRGIRDHDEVGEKSQSAKGDWVRRNMADYGTDTVRHGLSAREIILVNA